MPFNTKEKYIAWYKSEKVIKRSIEWRKKNRDKWNKYQRERRRGDIAKKQWLAIKSDPIKHEKHRACCLAYRKKNNDFLNERARMMTKELNDTYVRDQLIKGGASYQSLIDNPTIVEAKRVLLKIKRNIYGTQN